MVSKLNYLRSSREFWTIIQLGESRKSPRGQNGPGRGHVRNWLRQNGNFVKNLQNGRGKLALWKPCYKRYTMSQRVNAVFELCWTGLTLNVWGKVMAVLSREFSTGTFVSNNNAVLTWRTFCTFVTTACFIYKIVKAVCFSLQRFTSNW